MQYPTSEVARTVVVQRANLRTSGIFGIPKGPSFEVKSGNQRKMTSTTTSTAYQCEYCGTEFVLEARYMKHKCKAMERHELIRTPVGQAAWCYYQEWMKLMRKRVSTIDAFMSSKNFTTFVKFATFVVSVELPSPSLFIQIMTDKKIQPTLWCDDRMYTMYLEYIDKHTSPEKQAELTVTTLFKIADKQNRDVSEVFELIPPNEMISLLKQRRVSPWILLRSDKFKQYIGKDWDVNQKQALRTLIRPDYWFYKFSANPQKVETMTKLVSELGL